MENTIKVGPNLKIIKKLFRLMYFVFEEGKDPWAPIVEKEKGSDWLEKRLADEYIGPFANGDGRIYKEIRTCKNPDCDKLFVYTRQKQTFCSNNCRYDFHNRRKIQSGYMAAYQRKGRKENPAVYYRK